MYVRVSFRAKEHEECGRERESEDERKGERGITRDEGASFSLKQLKEKI